MDDKTHRGRTPAPIEANQAEPFRPLLRALVGRSSRDYLIRTSILQALAVSSVPVSSQDLGKVLPWIQPRTRSAALRALRHGGWLESSSEAGFALTESGRRAQEALAPLHRAGGEGASLEIRLAAGLTADEIATALRGKSLGDLATAGRAALLAAFPPLPLPDTDAVAQAAESHVRSRRL